MPLTFVIYVLLHIVLQSRDIEGHGRLIDPPSRASAWRYGFDTPRNYDDNQLFCGGKTFQWYQHGGRFGICVSLSPYFQWDQHGGRCGICGDPFPGPREHEAGGRYATGTITRSYMQGQTVTVSVELTANHMGWFEFRLCPVNDPSTKATQECLDQYLLPLADGSGTRLPIRSDMRHVEVELQLPRRLRCRQCVLQWKYNTGNSWGIDPATGRGCTGCGPQEQFYGCSDISIGRSSNPREPRPSSRPPPREPTTSTMRPYRPIPTPSQERPVRPTQPKERPVGGGGNGGGRRSRCKAVGAWRGQRAMNRWCRDNCRLGNCPPTHCRCR